LTPLAPPAPPILHSTLQQVPLSTTEPTTHHQRPNEEVLVGGLPVPRRHVLIPVDGTPQSEYMVDWALANFCREGDQVNLIVGLHRLNAVYHP
jgi:hypothetical protein